ncbi:hypothetical protein CDD81_869 [Ophiocordyceps australis]|uniref:Protein Zds1 C-terminal domain-containing protein n=1 Tax=Ophiocordyceps australis TaxID=1399860 RepID=A0A2C5YGB6_9HYPO|nr:hypothetical protein CDD81_869 [Ophiocordyceps australis]
MTSSRPRDKTAAGLGSRRGHSSTLSISDPSHHVTEAIGTLYGGDEEDYSSAGGARPLSFIHGSPYGEQIQRRLPEQKQESDAPAQQPSIPVLSLDVQNLSKSPQAQRRSPVEPSSLGPSPSPTWSLRDVPTDAAASGSQFPLTNMDNPSDIAQELSNLQALRRLSMDVGNSIDPDMPPGLTAMPVIAPTGDDDENDPSRLLWVPARVHPELAPSEFKSFLENRVQAIRRRSGDLSPSVDGDSSSPASSLRRKKSMLSRQIDNTGGRGAVGYVDGAERLHRLRSNGSQNSPELSIEDLVKDPTKAVQKLTQDSHDAATASRGSETFEDDMPILPMAPGMGLRRSTRTTYRKGGSLRSGDRGSLSRRLGHRPPESDLSEAVSKGDSMHKMHSESTVDKHTRPERAIRRASDHSQESHTASEGLSDEPVNRDQQPTRKSSVTKQASQDRAERPENTNNRMFPTRSSSQNAGSLRDHVPDQAMDDSSSQPVRRSATHGNFTIKQPQYTSKSSQNQIQMPGRGDSLASPSAISCGDASRTDNLTFIPTLNHAEKSKSEKKSRKDRDEDSAGTSSGKSGGAWKWLKGVADDREKKREEKREESRRSKGKAAAEKAPHDNVRLDLIQTSIERDNSKGRESLVLDRDDVDHKLLEERKKESNRKSDSKKDKDSSLISSIFGVSKKKDKDKSNKKSQHHLQVPEEMPYKPQRPDVDYEWTRFPLLKERMIYRMAHLKLANPRRSLLSQVLLSNFMYSYLAIVQAMHPQMNVPTSPQQKRLEEEARRKRQEQEYLAQQQTQDGQDDEDGLDQYNFEYHRAAVQYAESGPDEQVDYVDDAQIYEDEHGSDNADDYGYEATEEYGHESKDYLEHPGGADGQGRHSRDNMW